MKGSNMLYKPTKRHVCKFLFIALMASTPSFAGGEQVSVQSCFEQFINFSADSTLLSAQGHRVEVWQAGHHQWRATVWENLPNGFSLEYSNIPIVFEESAQLQCNNWHNASFVQRHLHVLLRNDLPVDFANEALVYIGSRGLKGGCQDCSEATCQAGEKCFFDKMHAQDKQFYKSQQNIMEGLGTTFDKYEDNAKDTLEKV
ncbi:MAG: hypothetical protein AAF320_06965, partial [Myxococcota bacterium]